MATNVPNKLTKPTMIVDIGVLGFNAHVMRLMRWHSAVDSPSCLKHVVHSLPACYVFHNRDSNYYFYFSMRGPCALYV